MNTQTTIKRYLSILRPHQWLKNLLLLFPPFFAGKILEPFVLAAIVPALLSFSFAASCGYIINDIKDRGHDRFHAVKKNRPIARGDISLTSASLIAGALYLTAMILAGAVSQRFEGYLIIYLLLSFLYSMFFKNIVIMDIFVLALGYIVRVMAGGEAFDIQVSKWLILTVFMVALFLSTGKRLGEFMIMGENAEKHRKSLNGYSASFLEGVLWFSAASALITYSLYCIENTRGMFYTVPLAAFGLIRYVYIAKNGRGDPTEALLQDWQIMITGVIWAGLIAVIIYP
jgi:decaprenyl-phosphate phosphoribosyltransferase